MNSDLTASLSCYSSLLLISYARRNGAGDADLFKGIEEYQNSLENRLEWTDPHTWTRLAQNIEKAFGDKAGVLFDIGEKITESETSNFQLFFIKIAPWPILISNITKHVETSINKTAKVSIEFVDRNRIHVKWFTTDKASYSSQICDFNKGCMLAFLKFKAYKNIRLEELQCAARDGSSTCIYQFTWDPVPGLFEKFRTSFLFRFRNQSSIIRHMEESHSRLRHQYEQILEMRDFYSHIMSSMSEAVIWLDKNGVVDFANRGFSSLTARGENESRGKVFSDFLLDAEEVAKYQALRDDCVREPLRPKIEALTYKNKSENRIGQTTIAWVPGSHRPPGFLISIRDLTETKKIEQQRDIAEDRYRALYENSPAIIVGLNREGGFIYANAAMVEQSGYTEAELKKMHFGQLVAPNAEFDAGRLLQTLVSQPTRLQEVHFKSKAGEWKCIALNTYHLFDDHGNLAGIAGIGVDITETKRLNEQLIKTQRMELLGQLAGGLAHDFNNIMTAVSGYAQLIASRGPDSTVREQGEIILHASSRASDLVKKLLSFSRSDAMEMKEIVLNDIVAEVGSLVRGSVMKSIDIEFTIQNAQYRVLADSTKIHQCILNLCLNARDAIGEKQGGRIVIRLRESGKADHVRVEVEDNGSGIPPDIIEKIFDPFFTTKKKKEGTGLGLSVVYGIVKAHKGEIFVDSRPGEGTTFAIEIPLSSKPEKITPEPVSLASAPADS